jgi:hypothetical protein
MTSRRRLAQYRRIRWATRATLIFGVFASTAANILHAVDNPISQAIAAWPPLALLLTVELTSRIPMHKRSLAALRVLATVAIAGIAAWVSYWHMQGVAVRYGEQASSAYLLPVSVDGLIVVSSICLVELAGRIRAAEDAIHDATTVTAQPAPAPPPVPPPVALTPALPPAPVDPAAPALVPAVVVPAPVEHNGHHPATLAARPTPTRVHVETARVPADRAEKPPRTPAKKPAGGRDAKPAARTDDELLAALAEVPRDEDGTVPVRRAAAALGTGPDRARRLLTTAGLRRDPDTATT